MDNFQLRKRDSRTQKYTQFVPECDNRAYIYLDNPTLSRNHYLKIPFLK
jgi:hypothetical protein